MTVASLPHQDVYYIKTKRPKAPTITLPVAPAWVEYVLAASKVDRVDLFARLDRGEVIETTYAWCAKDPTLLPTEGVLHRVPARQLMRFERNVWVGEASALGFPVGRWPHQFVIDGWEGGPVTVTFAEREEDWQLVVYTAPGYRIEVCND